MSEIAAAAAVRESILQQIAVFSAAQQRLEILNDNFLS